jgi:hypothetical protein
MIARVDRHGNAVLVIGGMFLRLPQLPAQPLPQPSLLAQGCPAEALRAGYRPCGTPGCAGTGPVIQYPDGSWSVACDCGLLDQAWAP